MLASIGFAVGLTLSSAAPAPQPAAIPALAIDYADGRRTVVALSTTGRVSWTTSFPRIDGAVTSRDGLPLFAMQYEEARERDGVALTVALLYGRPQERRVPVETVHVTATPVTVESLQAFGIRPVVFSIVSLPPASLTLPAATSASSSLEIAMETTTDPIPGYVATIANHGARDVMMLAYKGYRGQAVVISGRPRGQARTALIPPGGTYVLKLRASANSKADSDASAWLPLDRFEITSVLWSDDVVEGDPVAAANERVLDAGVALQLDRIVTVLRAAARNPEAAPIGALRTRIAGLSLGVTAQEAAAVPDSVQACACLPAVSVRSTMASGMGNARNAVLNDIDELSKAATAPAPAEYAAWLSRLVTKYSGWRSRITP